MKSIFATSLILLVILMMPSALRAQGQGGPDWDGILYDRSINTITTAVPFLMIAPDARAGALGDAGVSSSPDINSMHWNAAKYAFLEDDMGFALNYTPWLRSLVPDINLSYLTGYRRIDDLQTVAFSLKYFTLGEVNFTDNEGVSMGSAKPNEFSLDVAYARRLGDFISGAITGRFIYSDLTQGSIEGAQAGVAFAADVSVYYERPLEWEGTPATFAWGANISNIGNKITYTEDVNADFIPINLRIGPRITFDLDNFNQLSFMVDFNKLLVPTPPIYERDENDNLIPDGDGYLIREGRDPNRSVVPGMLGSFTDAPGGFREELNEVTLSVGAEYWYDQQFAIRAGYFHEHETKGNRKYFTVGVGLKYNVFGLDFAYVIPVAQRSPLENVLRFSLSFDLEGFRGQ